MYKCVISEYFGPFCGMGGYGAEIKVGMSRSPKQAVAKAKSFHNCTMSHTVNNGGGGVPIMAEFSLYKNGKLIHNYYF